MYAIGLLVTAAFVTLGALFYVGQIGKPRKPIMPSDAVVVVAIDAAIVAFLAVAAVHLLH